MDHTAVLHHRLGTSVIDGYKRWDCLKAALLVTSRLLWEGLLHFHIALRVALVHWPRLQLREVRAGVVV